jgi:hypothetical protein
MKKDEHRSKADQVRRDALEMLQGKRTTPYEFRAITKEGGSR